jgi:hypothetical protein
MCHFQMNSFPAWTQFSSLSGESLQMLQFLEDISHGIYPRDNPGKLILCKPGERTHGGLHRILSSPGPWAYRDS